VARIGCIRTSERVLDIAYGTGNTALVARARGATVTGVDLTPELLAVSRRRAKDAGYTDIAWKEGDAENLPFADSAIDVVVSSCGLMFAPNQQKGCERGRTGNEQRRLHCNPGPKLPVWEDTTETTFTNGCSLVRVTKLVSISLRKSDHIAMNSCGARTTERVRPNQASTANRRKF
jgi:SAM-dependent methyltransferase